MSTPSIPEKPNGDNGGEVHHKRQSILWLHDSFARLCIKHPVAQDTKESQSKDHSNTETKVRKTRDTAGKAILFPKDQREGREKEECESKD